MLFQIKSSHRIDAAGRRGGHEATGRVIDVHVTLCGIFAGAHENIAAIV